MIFVTGGAGFIGANFVLQWLTGESSSEPVINVDRLSYAGNLDNLSSLAGDTRHFFVQQDLRNRAALDQLFDRFHPRAVVHLAAETHVDRSIGNPEAFIQHNIVATGTLLDATLAYWRSLKDTAQESFRFLNASTDEVFGSLPEGAAPNHEYVAFAPRNPYASSKAAACHIAESYHVTYGLPTLTTLCSNNYGPYQFPEKLIPLMMTRALRGLSLPLYGDGMHRRDWLHVSDHCEALRLVLAKGTPGARYNIASGEERSNLEVLTTLCSILAEICPRDNIDYASLIKHVADRPGHDRRYALNIENTRQNLGWAPRIDFASGLRSTVAWYASHSEWIERIATGQYKSRENDAPGLAVFAA